MKHAVLVISDIHLGSANCNANALLRVLKTETAQTLVINGDLFDSSRKHRLKKTHWKILGAIRKLSKRTKVILINGNHDNKTDLHGILGFETHDEYVLAVSGIKFLFIHGDIFDFAIIQFPWCSSIIAELYYHACKNTWLRHHLNKWIHRTQSGVSLENAAVQYKKHKETNWICCGHTHFAKIDPLLGYLNSGTFTSTPPAYITIDFSGLPSIVVDDDS